MIVILQRNWRGFSSGLEMDMDPTQAGILLRSGVAKAKQQTSAPAHKMIDHSPHNKTSGNAAPPPQRHDGRGPGAGDAVPSSARPRLGTSPVAATTQQQHRNPGSPGKGASTK